MLAEGFTADTNLVRVSHAFRTAYAGVRLQQLNDLQQTFIASGWLQSKLASFILKCNVSSSTPRGGYFPGLYPRILLNA